MAIASNMEIFDAGRELVRDVTGRARYLLGPNLFPARCNAGRELSPTERARAARRLGEIPTRGAQDMRDHR